MIHKTNQCIGGSVPSLNEEVVVREYENLVYSIAHKLHRQLRIKVTLDDLIAYGFQGLLEANSRFDDDLGYAFSSFAYYRIRGAILDGCRKEGWLSPAKKKQAAAVRGINEQMKGANEASVNEPKSKSLAESASRLSQVAASAVTTVFFVENHEDLAFSTEANQDKDLAKRDDLRLLKEGMRLLTDQERDVLKRFYFEEESMRDIGESFGHSKSWVSRIHTRAIEKMRDHVLPQVT